MVSVQKKRKICFPIMNRVHYARQKYLLDLLQADSRIQLQVVVGGSALLEKYGERFVPALEQSGFHVDDALYNVIEGGNHIAMAKTAALTALEFSNSLYKLNPDIVLVRGDRFEQLAVAMVAAYVNKTVAHIEGGDVSGTIDESVRHAITKLAHIHMVTNEDARRRVIQMGERPASVFNIGSPDVEFAAREKKKIDAALWRSIGTGHDIDFTKPYLMVMYHPVTTEVDNKGPAEALLSAVDALNMQTVWFWPNSDAGTNEIAKAIRVWREGKKIKNKKIKFVTDVLPEDFIALLRGASVLVGNSSSGIKEASYLGVPVVNIGTRQGGRLRGPHVRDAGYDTNAIHAAIRAQLKHGPYHSSHLYYQPNTSERIVDILAGAELSIQKKFIDAEVPPLPSTMNAVGV